MKFDKSKATLMVWVSFASGSAWAQSSLTLYGVIDDSLVYQNSSTSLGSTKGGKANVSLISGENEGSRFGFRGVEGLGGGTQVEFTLENGFSTNSGALAQGGLEFGRRAFVGVNNDAYGFLTVGRQYPAYFTVLYVDQPSTWLGILPGAIDALDYSTRLNNSINYISPKYHGVRVGGNYALAGEPGSLNRGSTWSGAVQYAEGPIALAGGVMRINNSTPGGGVFSADSTDTSGGQTLLSSLTNGYQTAQAQQRLTAGGNYKFNPAWDLSLRYSNVQYIRGIGSAYRDTAVFNAVSMVLHWKPSVPLDLAVGLSNTRATKANGITNPAQYNQLNFTQYYAFSKRLVVYGYEGYQHANGKTLGTSGAGHIINATPTLGDFYQSSPSSSASQLGMFIGFTYRF